MKTICLILIIFLIAFGCKKAIQQKEENIIVQIMVNGKWKVTDYTKGTNDSTSLFNNYTFQFRDDNTVQSIINGSPGQIGTWQADISSETISSNFTNASSPLYLLNGTWKINNSTQTSVSANQTIAGELSTIILNKL